MKSLSPAHLAKSAVRSFKSKTRPLVRSVRMSVVCGRFLLQPLDETKIFVLGREGSELAGNLLRLMLSIRALYGDRFTFVAGARGQGFVRIRKMLDTYGFDDVRLVDSVKLDGLREMETAGYLLTDVTFPNGFIPRKGQFILNTWHGTPYKRMGIDTPSYRLASDNMQRNFFMADMLLFPSVFCRDVMAGAYCLDGLYRGNMVLAGYPRNSIFFDTGSRDLTRARYGLAGKKVWAYLPTWREAREGGIDHLQFLTHTFTRLDSTMAEDEVLFVKIHNYFLAAMKDLKLSFRHIRPWPEDVETYEFLNAADTLVTDYSSVFFDFACTRRKIVRYTYDEETYLATRGLYDLPARLPFPCVKTPDDLLAAMRSEKDYDDTAFMAAYCPWDGPDASDRLAGWFIERKAPTEVLVAPAKKRPLILLYAGCVKDRQALQVLTNRAAHLMENETNALLYLGISRAAQAAFPDVLNALPDGIRLFAFLGEPFCRTTDLVLLAAGRPTDRYLGTERHRALTGVHFDAVLDLSGGTPEARLFQGLPCTRFRQVSQLSADAVEAALLETLTSLTCGSDPSVPEKILQTVQKPAEDLPLPGYYNSVP